MWKLDRLSRRATDMLAVIDWCRATGRQVWETSGTEYTGPAGTLIVSVLGGLAQGERERMVERARASFDKLARSGRWRGGQAPWGYRVVVGDDGHKRLAVDDEAAAVVREVAARVQAGESINSVSADLNRRGVPTASGRGEWRMGNLQRAIKSDRLLGYMVREDKRPGEGRREYVVRGADGMPIQRAEPILTRAELSAIRAKLAANRSGGTRSPGVRADRALLLRVLWCGECLAEHERLEPMYRAVGGRGRSYYRCGSRARTGVQTCKNGQIGAETTEAAVVSAVMALFGDEPTTERVWEAGTDTDERIAELTEALRVMREDRAAGLYSSPTAAGEFRESYRTLEAQRERLDALPRIAAGWRTVETGDTLRARWDRADVAGRNDLLRASGLRVLVVRGSGARMQDPAERLRVALVAPGEELSAEEARAVVAAGVEAAAKALRDAM